MIINVTTQANLEQLMSLRSTSVVQALPYTSDPHLKANVMRDAALSLGAREGLKVRSAEILKQIKQHIPVLDQVYAFHSLVLEGGVIPPIIQEAQDALEINSRDLAKTVGVTYRLEQPARFSPTIPTWNDYLVVGLTFNDSQIDLPAKELWPSNEEESVSWKEAVQKGWVAGKEQADGIFVRNLERLESEFIGMLLYHQLYAQGKISRAVVAETALGTTGSATLMQIDEKIYRLTNDPTFQFDSKAWRLQP